MAGLTLFRFALVAQIPAPKCDPKTLDLIHKAAPWTDDHPGALIITRDCELTVDSCGHTKEVLHLLGKIYDKQARTDYSQIVIPFNSYYEDITLDFARTIQDDGTVRETPTDAIQIKTTPDASGGVFYTDNRFLSFGLFGVDVGVAFEYQATVIQKKPQMEGEWFDTHPMGYFLQSLSPPYLPRIDPVLLSQYTVRVPHGTQLQYAVTSVPVKPIVTVGDNEDKYRWEVSRLPAITVESAMPPVSELRPEVLVTSLKNWEQVDAWASRKFLPSEADSAEASALASSVTAGATTTERKIRAVFNYLQNNIQYLNADLERGGYTPHRVHDILASRYGDCKDQSFLFVAMLRALGLEAYPALISPFPYEEWVQVPSISFIHVITYIHRAEGDLWLDPTAGVTSFPRLYFTDQNRTAFVIDGKGGRLMRTPGSGAGENNVSVEFRTSFVKGDCVTDLTVMSNGAQSDLLKASLHQASKEQQQESFRSMIASGYPAAVVDTVDLTDVRNPRRSFGLFLKFHADTMWRKGMKSFTFGSFAGLALSNFANLNMRFYPATRHNNTVNACEYSVSGFEEYVPPENGLLPTLLPAEDSVSSGFVSFNRKLARVGAEVVARWTFATKSLNVPKERYQQMREDVKSIQEKAGWQVLFTNPQWLWRRALEEDGPQGTVKECDKLLMADPTYALALMLRGKARHELGQEGLALSDFEKALTFVPDNKYAHLWCGTTLMALGRPKDALAHFGGALRSDSTFDQAYIARGEYYYDNRLYPTALADFQKACTSNPENGAAFRAQGRALVALARFRTALDAFKRAVEIDSTEPNNYLGLGDALLATGSSDESKKAFMNVIRLNPKSALAYSRLGWLSYSANDDRKCIEFSRRAIDLDSTLYTPRYYEALALLRSGEVPAAKRIFDDLKVSGSSVPEATRSMAIWALRQLVDKGIRKEEASSILKNYFGIDMKK